MKRKHWKAAKIIPMLKEVEHGMTVSEVCRYIG